MANPPRFILHGIGGMYNYGCEAIVRGTETILRSQWPACRIVYLSWRPEEDRKALEGCDLEIWEHSLPRLHPKRVARSSLQRARLPYRWIGIEKEHRLGPGDCVLSIGGDIFTLGPGPYPKSGNDERLHYSNRLMNQGYRLVLWGASVGPFEAWPACIPHYQRFLKRLDLITVREPISRAYLESLGVSRNVVEVGDPAFVMEKLDIPGDFPFADADDPVLGVNLSPLSVNFAYGSDRMAVAMQDQTDVLEELIKTLGVRIVLIPHVIAPFSPADDDYAYLRAIHGKLSPLYSGRIALLPPNLGARRTKGVISHCDAVMAARMHCAVAAVSQGVPAVFLSYSAKAAGMARLVYGTDRYCLKMDGDFRLSVTGLLKDILGKKREVSAQIAGTSSQLRVRAGDAALALRDIVQ